MATRTRLSTMFYVHCLSRFVLYVCGCMHAQKTLGCLAMQNPETRVWNLLGLLILQDSGDFPCFASHGLRNFQRTDVDGL